MGQVFDRYTDTGGNLHYTDVETGFHVIRMLPTVYMKDCSCMGDNQMTNADKIRQMTDEELAEFLQDVAMQGGIELGGRPTTWLDWLKEEVRDESNY